MDIFTWNREYPTWVNEKSFRVEIHLMLNQTRHKLHLEENMSLYVYIFVFVLWKLKVVVYYAAQKFFLCHCLAFGIEILELEGKVDMSLKARRCLLKWMRIVILLNRCKAEKQSTRFTLKRNIWCLGIKRA